MPITIKNKQQLYSVTIKVKVQSKYVTLRPIVSQLNSRRTVSSPERRRIAAFTYLAAVYHDFAYDSYATRQYRFRLPPKSE